MYCICIMSLATFKKKSVIIAGTNISGKGIEGFSLNGRYRNIGRVGKDSIMSSTGTRFNGQFPYGYGGTYGDYKNDEIVFNVNEASAIGSQTPTVYSSVLSTYGMLQKRYGCCIYNGKYPTKVVKNIFTGNLTDNKSQGVYIRNIESSKLCVMDVNDKEKYIKTCRSSTECINTPNKKIYPGTFVGNYTKPVNGALDQSSYLLYVTKRCNQVDLNNDHIPLATNGNNNCIYGLCG